MDRRDFLKNSLGTICGYALLETVFTRGLWGAEIKPDTDKWLKSVKDACLDLRKNALTPVQWQGKMDELHKTLGIEDLASLIDFSKVEKAFQYPDLGVTTKDAVFPKIEGVSDKFSFTGRIFGMKQERAIIPHGHRNMVSCHRVLKGEFHLRQYDRMGDEGDYMLIKQTLEETAKPGSFSSISDEKNNVHWLIAQTVTAFTFDVIVAGLNHKVTEIDNIDIEGAQKEGGDMLRVKRIKVDEALKKYGYDTHH